MLRLSEMVRACRGDIISGDPSQTVSSVSIDTRTIKPGALFVAIKGARFDGHRFAARAVERGATAVIVSRRVRLKGAAVIQVDDTVRALGQIAACHRRNFSGTIIAVTGSAGKTSTRKMIAAVLKEKYRVLQSARSENNWIGVPLTLLKLTPEHEIAVVEAGTNQPGDMPWLARIIRPDIVIFTNIGDSHLEKLKSRAGVYREKISLAKKVATGGKILYNADDEILRRIPAAGLAAVARGFSIDAASSYRARNISVSDQGHALFTVNGQAYSLPSSGRHHIYNALAAIACARLLRVPPVKVAKALAGAMPDDNRGRLLKTQGGVWILDDTYNANPLSFQRALEALSAITVAKRRLVVGGDMLELGESARRLHEDLGRQMAAADVDIFLGIGSKIRFTAQSFDRFRPLAVSSHYNSVAALHRCLGRMVRRGDVVLVKGSRSMRMERTVAYLKQRLN